MGGAEVESCGAAAVAPRQAGATWHTRGRCPAGGAGGVLPYPWPSSAMLGS